AAAPWTFAAVRLADRVTPPWEDELPLILRGDTGQRHGMIVAQRHFVVAVGFEAVDQLLVVADLALQRRGVFDDRRVERLRAIALEHAGERVENILPQEHRLRQVVAHAFDILGFGAHTASCLGCETCVYDTICRSPTIWRRY